MRHGFRVLLVLAGAVPSGVLPAQQSATPVAPRVRVGVMPLGGTAVMPGESGVEDDETDAASTIPPPSGFARGLTEMLTTSLVAAGPFVVLERAQLTRVLGEQNLGVQGLVTPQSAAKAGRLLGAQVLIFGDITEYAYSGTTTGGKASLLGKVTKRIASDAVDEIAGQVVPGGVSASVQRVTAKVAIDLRLVDATTGQVLQSVRGKGSAHATGIAAEFVKADKQIGAGATVRTPLGKASRQAIDDAVQQMANRLREVPWSGVVAEVRGSQVYINAGSDAGVSVGLELGVLSAGGQVVDPGTGEVLGAPTEVTGRIRIVRVARRYSVGVKDTGQVRKGDIVRF